ncbi:MAG: hypothetical protein AAGD34_07670 [Pseudomonadota bacterium]
MTRTAAALAIVAAIALGTAPLTVLAGDATVEAVRATKSGDTWTFHVTVRHADTGWDHYADAFTIHATDGTEIGRRTLFHPHVDEQPFTRSLSGVALPEGTTQVLVRAHDNVDGPGPTVTYTLP